MSHLIKALGVLWRRGARPSLAVQEKAAGIIRRDHISLRDSVTVTIRRTVDGEVKTYPVALFVDRDDAARDPSKVAITGALCPCDYHGEVQDAPSDVVRPCSHIIAALALADAAGYRIDG